MRNIFYIFLIFINFSFANAEQKIAYIDIDYIIKNSVVGKQISEHISNLKNSKIKEFKVIEKKFKDKEKKLIAKKNIISDDKFKSEINSLNKELKTYNDQRMKFSKNLEQKKINLTKQLLKTLNPIISEFVNQNQISLVLSKSNIIVGKKNLDITSSIIENLNNKLKTINFNE